MRGILLGFAALSLAACDGGVPPPGQEALRPSNPQVEANEVVLRADGLIAGPEAFYFAAGQSEVESAVGAALGAQPAVMTNDECGAGPMTFLTFGDGLALNFQNGSLVGWALSQAAEGVRIDGDVAVGMSRAQIEAENGYSMIDGSTLGEEFSLGQVGGFVEDDAVSMLYAGKQCFFR